MESLYLICITLGIIMCVVGMHVLIRAKKVNETLNSIFKYSSDLRATTRFTIVGRVFIVLFSYVVYAYGIIFSIAVIFTSVIAGLLLLAGWYVWFVTNILAFIFIKKVTWSVPYYHWNSGSPKFINKEDVKQDDVDVDIFSQLVIEFGLEDTEYYERAVEYFNGANENHPEYHLTIKYSEDKSNGFVCAKIDNNQLYGILTDLVERIKLGHTNTGKINYYNGSDMDPGIHSVKNEVYYYQNFNVTTQNKYTLVLKSRKFKRWLKKEFIKPEYDHSRTLINIIKVSLSNDIGRTSRVISYIKADAYLDNVFNTDIVDT